MVTYRFLFSGLGALWVSSAMAAACDTGGLDRSESSAATAPAVVPVAPGSVQARATLRFVNHAWTDWSVLHREVRLPSTAALEVVLRKDGPDWQPGTADDRPFGSLAELAAVPGVDAEAIDRLMGCAIRRGWVPGGDPLLGVFDGVRFTLDEAERTLATANGAPRSALDEEAGLYANAVTSIVAARPFATLDELVDLSYLGPVNVKRLRAYALSLAAWDEPPCPLSPVLTVAEATAVDFAAGDFTVCAATSECAPAEAVDGGELVAAAVGQPRWSACSWQGAATCGPFAIGSATCCYVVAVDAACR